MVLFIILYIVFYSFLGMRLFQGTVEGVQYFSTFVDSCFNMLVLLTTSNFPDIMLPAYEQSRIYCLFFISYLLIGLFLILNLLMAVFYNNYQRRQQSALVKFVNQRNQYLDKKFDELDKERKGFLNKQETYEMFKQIHMLDVQEDSVNIKMEHFDHMFYLLDTVTDSKNEGKIQKTDFMKIFEVYELWKYEYNQSTFFDQRTDMYQNGRFSFRSAFYTNLRAMVRSLEYEYIMNFIGILQFMELAFRDTFYSVNNNQINIWFIVQISINMLFLATLILDWIFLGLFRSYYKHPRVFVETICLFISIMAIVQYVTYQNQPPLPDEVYTENYYDFTFKFDVIKIYETVVIVSVQISIYYVYALIGQFIFGGKITWETQEIRNNESTPDRYALNNFNDMISSFVTLFELMVVNNWYITTEMYVNIYNENKFVLIYFVSFYNWGVLVGLNIIVAFAIDMYGSIERLDKQKQEHEDKLHKLAVDIKQQRKRQNVSDRVTIQEETQGEEGSSIDLVKQEESKNVSYEDKISSDESIVFQENAFSLTNRNK
eukprot:403366203